MKQHNLWHEKANSFIFEVHDNIVDLPGSTRARESLVKSALAYLNSLAQEAGDDPALQRELAAAYQRVGDVQGNPTNANLGDTRGALESYHKALTITEALLATNPTDTEAQRSHALTYQKLSDLQGWTGDLHAAVESSRKSLGAFKALAEADHTNSKSRQSLAISHIKLGDILGNPAFPNVGDRKAALDHYRLSLGLWQALNATDSTDATNRRYLGLIHERIGTMLEQGGQIAEALGNYQQSLVIRQAFVTDYQTNTDARRDLAVAYEKIAKILVGTDPARGLEQSRKSVEIFEALSAADPNNVNASRSLSISCENSGDIFLKVGDTAGALDRYQKSVEIHEALSSAGPSNVQLLRDLAKSYAKLGAAYAEIASTKPTPVGRPLEQWRKSESWYQRSLNLWRDLRNRGVTIGDDLSEIDRISKELERIRIAAKDS